MQLPVELDPQECRNLMLRARHPAMALRLLGSGLVIIMRSLLFRLLPARNWYPPTVRRALRGVTLMAASTAKTNADTSACPAGPVRLKLAVGYLDWVDASDWHRSFEDSEQFVSLHRWSWLLCALTDEATRPDLAWGVALMRSYLRDMTALPHGLASESYTVGERIANGLLFARVASGDWHSLPQDVQSDLGTMAAHLAQHLEYHGRHATGNHPLNNARALYLAGQCLGQPALRRLALVVMAERLDSLLMPDGFMREGSSHYHLLFTRWLLELQFAAREFADTQAQALLEQPVKRALARCWFFLVPATDGKSMLPAFGDVSPDCEPTWLLDLVLSPLALASCRPAWLIRVPETSGWARLWHAESPPAQLPASACSVTDPCTDGLQSFTQSGWHRLQWRGWTALWRTEPGGQSLEASHAHQDLCSLVLYHCSREVLIDIGRPDYDRGSSAGMHAVTHRAHNTLCLDGLGPMLTRRDRFLLAAYRRGAVQVTASQEGDSFRFVLAHEGFMRIAGGGVRHTRSFTFSTTVVEIEDVLQGQGRHDVALYFHWASRPGPGSSGATFQVREQATGIDGCQTDWHEAETNGLSGWRFPAYGVRQSCVTQMIRGVACLPSTIRHIISIQD